MVFSSASALLGTPGQSSYNAANHFLDAPAAERRYDGLAALTIAWGAWSQFGMAAALDDGDQRRIAARGFGSLDPQAALQALELLLGQSAPQVAVLPIDWQELEGSEAASRASRSGTGVGAQRAARRRCTNVRSSTT